MKTEFIVISWLAIIGIAFFAYLQGLDLRKWSTWLYGAISVLILILNLGLSVKTVVMAVSSIAFIWIVFGISSQGLDLRKRSSWLYGATGFLCGLALSTAISGDLIGSLKFGAIFGFMILFTGVTMRGEKQKSKRMARSLVQEYGKEDPPSLFAKLVKKLLDKYK